MNKQRIAIVGLALLGALTPALPWRELGMLSTTLSVDSQSTALVAGGFLVAALFGLIGDRTKPTRSARGAALGISLVGSALLWLVVLFGQEVSHPVTLGIGAYVAGFVAAVLVLGAWTVIDKPAPDQPTTK